MNRKKQILCHKIVSMVWILWCILLAIRYYDYYQEGRDWTIWIAIIFGVFALFLLAGNLFLLLKKGNKNKSTVRKICENVGKTSWLLTGLSYAYIFYLSGDYGMFVFSIIFGLQFFIFDFVGKIILSIKNKKKT